MQHKCNKCTYKATHNPNHRNLVKSVQGTHVTSITNVYKVEHKYDMKTQILYINKAYTTTVINLKLSTYILILKLISGSTGCSILQSRKVYRTRHVFVIY